MKKFEILKKELAYDNPWMPIEKQRVKLPSGKETDWYIATGRNVIIAIPMLENGDILLQRAYKHGCGEIVTEFCAGIIEDGEEPQKAAERELLEETGYKAESWEFFGEYFANPTGSKTVYHIFLAKGCKKVAEPQLDAAEQIENFSVSSVEEAENILLDPKNQSSITALAALSFLVSRHY